VAVLIDTGEDLPMPTPAEVETLIAGALPGARIEVRDTTGTGDHFLAIVVAEQFRGKTLVEQHQMVYAPLRDLMATNEIHALSLKTSAPEP
jgi:acid stress-induced BolA-like protein IbaG/YrbA